MAGLFFQHQLVHEIDSDGDDDRKENDDGDRRYEPPYFFPLCRPSAIFTF